MLLRFREWPDEDMARFDKLLKAGKPIVALRTSTHAFNGFPKGSPWESWNYNNDGGFGKRVLGETWLTHWGKHKSEATRGEIEPAQRNHPVLRGITSIFADTDVYEAYPPADATILVRGIVLHTDLTLDASPATTAKPGRPTSRSRGSRSGDACGLDPIEPERHRHDQSRSLTTTMGSATDFEDEGTAAACRERGHWGLGLDVPSRADVTLVDEYRLSFYGFDGFRKGLHASDFELGKKVPADPLPRPSASTPPSAGRQ